MSMPQVGECLLFDAKPDDVIRVLEEIGAVRNPQSPWVWLHISGERSGASFRLAVASWEDANRLGFGSTISHEINADMTADESWAGFRRSPTLWV